MNQFDVEPVFFEMAGLVTDPRNCLIDGDRAVGEPQMRRFRGFGGASFCPCRQKRCYRLLIIGDGVMLDIPLFSFLAFLAALFSIRVFMGFFFSSFFLSSPLLMVSTP